MEASNWWYFSWLVTRRLFKGATPRGVIMDEYKWLSGEIIPISFLGGEPNVRERVRQAALLWTSESRGPANVMFDFRNDPRGTVIRIAFRPCGSWSMIGTTCREVSDATIPTMNFGWLHADTPQAELEGVVLHEFGHALGLVHEHQSPAGGIQWDEAAVREDLSEPPNNWTWDVIQRNVLDRYDSKRTTFTPVADPKSIMMYPVPARWTRGTFSSAPNLSLSDGDRDFMREQYR